MPERCVVETSMNGRCVMLLLALSTACSNTSEAVQSISAGSPELAGDGGGRAGDLGPDATTAAASDASSRDPDGASPSSSHDGGRADSGAAPPPDAGTEDGATAPDGAVDGSCDMAPSGCQNERCDEIDNDDDGWIDENSYVCFQEPEASTIDHRVVPCPSPASLRAIDADLDIRAEYGPLLSGDEVVCSEAESGRELTRVQKHLYTALMALRAIEFDQPLPWTDQDNLYAWLVERIAGIRLRSDVGASYCCQPPEDATGPYVNIAIPPRWESSDLFMSETGVDVWGLAELLVHEANHTVRAHSCNGDDQTIAELGSWGVVYYLNRLLAYHSDPCFVRPDPTGAIAGELEGEGAYLERAATMANRVHRTRFCAESSVALPPPPVPLCGDDCSPSPERCNLIDDDCDGRVDEEATGYACGTDEGVCTAGTVTACEGGLERCSGQSPGEELCFDSLDNDCDGSVDEQGCSACAGRSGEIRDQSVSVHSQAALERLRGVGCITGSLQVMGPGITDLSPLSNLQAVGGDLAFRRIETQDMGGLDALEYSYRLFLVDNPELTTLRGLEGLQEVGWNLWIRGNTKLESLDGLDNLGRFVSINIEYNPALTSLDGIDRPRVDGGLSVSNNERLPQCQVDALATRVGLACAACTGNGGACAP